jgi:hypothetical protein
MTAARAILTTTLVLVLAGCGTPSSSARVPAGATAAPAATTAQPHTPAAATPAPTAPPPPPPLVVVSDQTGLRLLDIDGRTLGSAAPFGGQLWQVETGPGGAFWVSRGRLHRLGADGQIADLGAASVPYGFAVSPRGDAIAYGTSDPAANGTRLDNRLFVVPNGGPAQLLATRIADVSGPPPADAPRLWQYRTLGWTDAGILIAREPEGGCGCGPFGMESVDWFTALVDPATGDTTPVNDSTTCPLSAVGPGGLAACFHTPQSRESAAADSLRILRHGAVVAGFDLSRTTVGGSAVFSPDGGRIAYATVPEKTDCGVWESNTTMRVLDIASGNARGIPIPGLQPIAWLPDGRILAVQAVGRDQAQTTRVVTVDPASGTATTIHSSAGPAIVRVAPEV